MRHPVVLALGLVIQTSDSQQDFYCKYLNFWTNLRKPNQVWKIKNNLLTCCSKKHLVLTCVFQEIEEFTTVWPSNTYSTFTVNWIKKMSLFGMEQIQKLEKTLESYPSINSALVSLEKKTKIQKLYLIYGNYLYIFAIFLDTYFLRNFLGCTLLQACILVRLQFLSALSSCFSQLI